MVLHSRAPSSGGLSTDKLKPFSNFFALFAIPSLLPGCIYHNLPYTDLFCEKLSTGSYACRNSGAETEYRTFNSPDGRYKIVVYRVPETSATMPGQAGDAPGPVCLYETANGKLLNEKRVEMVQVIDQISWSATNVDIKLFADWKLP